MKLLSFQLALLSLLILNGCNSDGASSNGDRINLSPDVRPISDDNWYRPSIYVTWQWQLEGDINTSYDVDIYDIDLFNTQLSTIQELQSTGKKVICYFSAGSYEKFRSDKNKFLPEVLGKELDGWDNELWLDIRTTNVQSIMLDRLELAKQKGCDGVEPDNMDGYVNDSGFSLTTSDQLHYNRFIANEAHKRGLSVGLKNDLDQINELVEYFDFAVNEQCFEFGECNTLLPFIKKGKPVLSAEYQKRYLEDITERNMLCNESIKLQFSTLILPLDLNDVFRFSCL
ncbi:endo alpha-1,4 polygalactosaminidase [Sedimenticola sp.]|uniref:endo alpha-1,4 polygalactosaminidase n=1 Tax=Sedimenticola sp. TaxID=1940285 RepID=UPI003D13A732